jgi:nucleotide-binding universal stress UspA family protein
MVKSILVPLDGSKFSESSLPLAMAIGRATGARLHLTQVHVPYEPEALLGSTPFQFEGVDIEEYDAHRLEQDEAYISQLGNRIGGDGVDVEFSVFKGQRVADGLAGFADELGADLIVMASHGHTGASRVWLGSVADELVRHSHKPLLVSRPVDGVEAAVPTIRRILVPLDGSKLAEGALGSALDVARATGARITLAYVVTTITMLGPRSLTPVRRKFRAEHESAEAYLEGVAARLRAEGLDVDTRVVEGKTAAQTLSELADAIGADMIAMATHGYGGVRRTLLGSVADKLLRLSSLPVLITSPAAAA